MQVSVSRGCIWQPHEHFCYKILKNDTATKIGTKFAISISELGAYNGLNQKFGIAALYFLAIPVRGFKGSRASANATVRGQGPTIRQSKFDALAELALKAGVDAGAVAALRARPE
jgi:hypothetical protein